jgi:hypothetical protein
MTMKGSRLLQGLFLGALIFCALLTCGAPANAVSKADEMAARDHINKGNFYLGRRQFQEAIGEYEEALRIDSSSTVAKDNIVLSHNNWGIHFFQQRKYEEAEKEWRKALSLDATNQLAKHNIVVLKQTLARTGQVLPSEAAAQNPDKTPKKSGPTSSITILTPGLKQSSTSSAASTTAEPAAEPSSSGGDAGTPATPAAAPTAPADSGFDTPPTSSPAQTSGSSFEDQLTGIEVKIYGRRQPDMSVIKRLEKIETDTTGQCGTGTIKERIDKLRRSYGL